MTPTARRDLVDAVRTALAAHACPTNAAAQQRYMKSAMPYLGLTMPTLRATLRPVLGEAAHRIERRPEWEATVRALWDEATHREHWYAALALLRHRHYRAWHDPQLVPLVRHLVVTGAWWDVVDELAGHVVRDLLLHHRADIEPVVRSWAREEQLWLRRTAILAQLGARNRTDTRLLAAAIGPSMQDPDFFARKAIGWALRDYARTDPAWVLDFVATHPRLSTLSRREALKHLAPGQAATPSTREPPDGMAPLPPDAMATLPPAADPPPPAGGGSGGEGGIR